MKSLIRQSNPDCVHRNLKLLLILSVFFTSASALQADQIYAHSYSGGGQLITIDPATGATSVIGPLGVLTVKGLALASNGTLYGVDPVADQLMTIDTDTGAATAVGSLGNSPTVDSTSGLAFDAAGTLFAVDIGSDQLLTINTGTGAATAVGPLGFGTVQGLAFSPSGTLYGVDGGQLLTINTSTGAASAVGFIGFSQIRSLTFSPSGILYAVSRGSKELLTINTSTGAGTAIGSVAPEDVESIAFHAGGGGGGDYTKVAETLASGRPSSSVSYSHQGAITDLAGLSVVSSAQLSARHGYIGQLYDPASLQISADPAPVNETESRQLEAALVMDDDTMLPLAGTDLAWSVMAGPFTGITMDGLATADVVYQNTGGLIQGIYQSFNATLNLTVIDSIGDNFGTYGADTIDDGWQVQYFGIDNPLAAPNANPDGDAHNNKFEFVAGLIPTDASSFFLMRSRPDPLQTDRFQVIISPHLPDRTYVLLSSRNLGAGEVWTPVAGATFADDGSERIFTDPNPAGTRNFYQIQIAKP